MKRVGRSMFRKIYLVPLLGVLLLTLMVAPLATAGRGTAPHSGPAPLFTALFCALGFWLIFGRRIAYRLVPLFVSKVTCPGCHEEIDAVNNWNCACGFHDHQERHLLAKRCPKCGKATGHVNCPRCDCTILLW